MKRAYTLAEVLIMLFIIGIIFTLTIPSLIEKTQKRELSTKFAKIYSVINRGVKQAEASEGNFITEWRFEDGRQVYEDYFRQIFSVTKTCKANESGCGIEAEYKYLNGIPVSTPFPDTLFRFWTADGAFWAIGINKGCIESRLYCALIRVDINGEAKPNMYGRDVFTFFMLPYTNEIRPEGLYDFPTEYDYNTGWKAASVGEINSDCSQNGGGLLCGARIVREGFKMNY